jgi:hypothetical protein
MLRGEQSFPCNARCANPEAQVHTHPSLLPDTALASYQDTALPLGFLHRPHR